MTEFSLLHPIGLVCLDMAGTTVRDGGLVARAFDAAVAEVGLPEDREAEAAEHVRRTMGQPKGVVFAGLFSTPEEVAAAVAAFDRAVLDEVAGGSVTEIEGAGSAMGVMREAGVKICLTTGFTADVQDAIVDHLGWRDGVDLVLCPTDGIRGRPYPDLVLAAALRVEIDDVRSVAVAGDTVNDLWSGYRAGASVVAGVLTGTHGRAELEAGPHTHVLESVVDLPEVVLGS